MSRFLKVMIVLLAIAAMATPVIAADNLSLSGSMRVRGAYTDSGVDPTSTTIDHRLRVGGKFMATDAISLTFRTDFSEGQWGSDMAVGRFGTIKDMDRAHLDINTDTYHLRAGTQYIGTGGMYAFDAQENGIKLDIKGSVPFSLFYILDENNGASSDDFFVGATASFSGFGLYSVLSKTSDAEVTLFGATYKADYDGIKVAAELDFFTGDADATNDAVGTQAMIDVSMAASEAATVGGRFFYAVAAGAGETQISYLGNGFNGYDPLNYGPYENENLQNITRPADAFGDAGVMALQLYTNFKASDAVNLTGSIAFAQPEDDAVSTGGDDALFLNAGMTYALMQNATIKSQVQYVDYDADSDANMSVGLGLWVNF